jgi:integrase
MARKTVPKMKGVSSVTRNGVGYWYAYVGGRKVYCGEGDKGRGLAEAARAKHMALKYEHREHRAGIKTERPQFSTIRDLSDWYMTLPSVQEQKSFYRKTNACAHLLEYFGNKSLSEAEGDDQERYRKWRKDHGASDGTLDYELELLSAMYHMARRGKKIAADSLPGMFVMKREYIPRPRVTESQYTALLEHAEADFRDILICGYESAMRSSEICRLTPAQVKLNVHHISGQVVNYIDLGIFDTKTHARRTVPVSAALKEVLERRSAGIGPEDRIFTFAGKPATSADVTGYMRRTCEKAGIPYGDKEKNRKGEKVGIVFHCLRSTWTSQRIEQGFSEEIIRRATGHSSLKAFQSYVKLDASAVMRLVETNSDNFSTKTMETKAR